MKKIIPLAILAGICISIGCVVNLRVGGVAGAVLFAFGLTTVVYYGLKLYTGTAGFIPSGERTFCLFPAGYWLWIYHDNGCRVCP